MRGVGMGKRCQEGKIGGVKDSYEYPAENTDFFAKILSKGWRGDGNWFKRKGRSNKGTGPTENN